MRILALDLAASCGWATGIAGETPRASVWRLRKKGQDTETAARNLGVFLRDLFVLETPDLIAAEDFMSLAAQLSAASGEMALRLHGALDAVAGAYGIPVRRTGAATIRCHFIGQSTALPARKRNEPPRTAKQKADAREATKRMVFKRAQALGYIERGAAENFDMSDALAVWDYAAATFARASRPLVMFGSEATP